MLVIRFLLRSLSKKKKKKEEAKLGLVKGTYIICATKCLKNGNAYLIVSVHLPTSTEANLWKLHSNNCVGLGRRLGTTLTQ